MMRVILILVIMVFMPVQSFAASVIRDTEIEVMLKQMATPLFRAANMSPDSVDLIVINSPEVNAFVAGGANIFIYTGLLLEARSPDEITGVIAHELGHIAGGHLIATRMAAQRAGYEAMLASILGVGAAFATGDAGAAIAVSSAGRQKATRDYLTHSRGQESSADQAAVTFMNKAKINPSGLSTFLEHLGTLSYSPSGAQAAYTRTHPLTSSRILALKKRIGQSPYKQEKDAADKVQQFLRMRAKLMGFLHPSLVKVYYPISDKSVPAQYARAIAAYRKSQIKSALVGMDALLEKEPNNPYFLELKGQILFESGKAAQSLEYYSKALKIAPTAGLIRIAYGHALIESGQFEKATQQLKRAVRDEPKSPLAQRLLATAYGRMGDVAHAHLHMAEEALLKGDNKTAMRDAKKAKAALPQNSVGAIQAEDILKALDLKK